MIDSPYEAIPNHPDVLILSPPQNERLLDQHRVLRRLKLPAASRQFGG
jgi:hypothetical protein